MSCTDVQHINKIESVERVRVREWKWDKRCLLLYTLKLPNKVQTIMRKADDAQSGSNHTFCDSKVEGEKAYTPRNYPGDALTPARAQPNRLSI